MKFAPLVTAASALALAACATTGEDAQPVAEADMSAEHIFGGDFTYDKESGSMVSTKGDSPYPQGDFNPGADTYQTEAFDGGRAFSPDSFAQRSKAYATSDSDYRDDTYGDGDSRFEGENSRFDRRGSREQAKRYKGVDIPANPYERSSAMLGSRTYEPARQAQEREEPLKIIGTDPNGLGGPPIREDVLSEADVRALLDK